MNRSYLVEIVWPQNEEMPDDLKVFADNDHYYIDVTSPVLITKQKAWADAMDARQKSVALQARVDELEAAAEYALKELGFPTDNYPAPVVNAWLMLKAVLDRGRSGRGREDSDAD